MLVGGVERGRGGRVECEGTMFRCFDVSLYAQWDATDSGLVQQGGREKSLEVDGHGANCFVARV